MRHTFAEKRAWVLSRLQSKYEQECRTHYGQGTRPFISGSDQDDQRAWNAAFGGKEVIYTIGPNVSPDFARTLRRMFKEGDLARVTGGNQEARHYCQKTYYVAYTPKKWPTVAAP
jgi:hypothetical protein